MYDSDSVSFVIGPDGEKMTVADLPAPDTRRWVPRRKARVVAAVEGGLISAEDAFARYDISAEEYECWKAALSKLGMKGLRVTKLNQLRTTPE